MLRLKVLFKVIGPHCRSCLFDTRKLYCSKLPKLSRNARSHLIARQDAVSDRWADKILYSSVIESNRMNFELKMMQQEKKLAKEAAQLKPFPVALKQLSSESFNDREEEQDTETSHEPNLPSTFHMPYERLSLKIPKSDASPEADLSTGTWLSDYEYYDEDRQDDDEVSFYGTPDPEEPVSQIPCGGCGALLHCIDPSIPGYLPSQLFKGKSKGQLMTSICQRCHFLKNYNLAVNVTVSSEDYTEMLLSIKDKKALAILLVDLLDIPCSIWPGLADVLGPQRPIIVAGNKIDLIPQDCSGYLENVRQCLTKTIIDAGFSRNNIKHVSLISANTGFGVEELITKIHNVWGTRGDVYLVGCTNVGKSTLFNTLLQSDLCKVQATDLVQKATASPWPGTTLRMLKFPILRPSDYRLFLRTQRLQHDRHKLRAVPSQKHPERSKQQEPATMIGYIGRTFDKERQETLDGFSVTQRTGANTPIPMLNEKNEVYARSKWCYDTPGVVQPEQILDLLTTEEILRTVPNRTIRPRAYLLKRGMTIFLAGLGRLDYVDGPDSVRVMLYAAPTLPTLITYTAEAAELYETMLGSPLLAIPTGGQERLSKWPPLRAAPDILLYSTHEKHLALCDILLSSAGWFAIHLPKGSEAVFRAWTPDRRGVYVRQPPLLPNGMVLRGKRIRGSLAYRYGKPFQA